MTPNNLYCKNIDELNVYDIDIPKNSIDLTFFSPPYDAIRDYKDKPIFDRKFLGKNLLDITKDGGWCIVNIQDQTKDFAKSLTSFKWAIEWAEIGWKLFECCIYHRHGVPGAWWNKRFRVDHEYLLMFFKGDRPGYFNKQPLMIPAKRPGEKYHAFTRKTDGTKNYNTNNSQPELKCRGTVWHYNTSSTENNRLKSKHPATMPDKMAYDMITCFSKEGDVVFDPFMGSGTTIVAAHNLKRNFIGIDINQEYIDIAKKRLEIECVN